MIERPGEQPTPPDDAAWHGGLRRAPGTAVERIERFAALAVEGRYPDVFLRLRLPEDLAGSFLGAVESRRQLLSGAVEGVAWYEPWPYPGAPASVLAARTFSVRCRRAPAWVGLLALIEDYARTWDDPANAPRRAADVIYKRDGWRCMAPGCTSRRNLEDHHVIFMRSSA